MDMLSYLLGRNSGGGKGALKVEVVQELPEVGEANILYLVPRQTSETNNVFDEYIWINNDYELIGTTEIEVPEPIENLIYLKYPDNSADAKAKLGEAITKSYQKGLWILSSYNSEYSDRGLILYNLIWNKNNNYEFRTKYPVIFGGGNFQYMSVSGSWSNDIYTVSSITWWNTGYNQVLATDNTSAYTPRNDYNPSTKQYSDLAPILNANNAQLYKQYTNYYVNDVVYFDGKYYKCIQNTSGQAPTNASYWSEITLATKEKTVASQKYVDDIANPVVTTSSTSTYTIASLVGNQTYKLSEITSLTITDSTTFDKESIIYFESGSTGTSISIPDSLTNLGDVPTLTTASNVSTGTCDTNKNYIIAILNNIAVWKKY